MICPPDRVLEGIFNIALKTLDINSVCARLISEQETETEGDARQRITPRRPEDHAL